MKRLQELNELMGRENKQILDQMKQLEQKYFEKKEEKRKLVELYNKLKHKFENFIIDQQNQSSKSNVQKQRAEQMDKTLNAKVIPLEGKKSLMKQSTHRDGQEEKLFELGPVQSIQKPMKRSDLLVNGEPLVKKLSEQNLRKSKHQEIF